MTPSTASQPANALLRGLGLLFGVAAYAAFNGVIMYSVGFVGNVFVPRTIDAGPETAIALAVLIDTCLLAVFGLQHSVMARPGFKARWTRIVPEQLERTTYVAISSVLLALVMWLWRPIPIVVWHVDAEWARIPIWFLFGAGWFIALTATFQTDHNELLGLKQSIAYFRGRAHVPAEFKERVYYRWVRHPIMFGQTLAFWAIPTMTLGHLLFASIMLVYVLIGLYYEERDLVAAHGDAYRNYQKRTPKLIPRPPRNN